MSVIEHDFGKERRETARAFNERVGLERRHEAKVLENPLPYLERAGERIFRLEAALTDAAAAAREPLGESSAEAPPADRETVTIDKAEYERLLRCRAIIDEALAKYGTVVDLGFE